MNADSGIRFPVQTRQVSLKGEAYFKVEKDSLHPFIVNVYDKLKVEYWGQSSMCRLIRGMRW